jgi:hypothetical protein
MVMHIRSTLLRSSVATTAALAAFLAWAQPASADDGAPLERLTRAARIECGSTAAASNLSCQLLDAIRACQQGEPAACELAGKVNMTRDVHDVPRASATAFFLLRACKLAPAKCTGFVQFAMRWYADAALAGAFLDAGCTQSVAVCRAASSMYLVGREIPADKARARVFARRACAAGDAASCIVGRTHD